MSLYQAVGKATFSDYLNKPIWLSLPSLSFRDKIYIKAAICNKLVIIAGRETKNTSTSVLKWYFLFVIAQLPFIRFSLFKIELLLNRNETRKIG